MAEVGAFINLPSDSETDNRVQILARKLNRPPRDINCVYGRGVYSAYDDLALQLSNNNSDAKCFVTTCWPTTDALSKKVNRNSAGIVFAGLTDSAVQRGLGYAPNVTGVRSFLAETLCPNWPYLLTQLQPQINRIAVIYDQNSFHAAMTDQWNAIQSVTTPPASVLSLTFTPIDARSSVSQIESEINTFVTAAGSPNTSGLIVTSGTLTAIFRRDIPLLAAKYNLPAIYPNAMYTSAGGLMSYGPDLSALYEKAATDFMKPILSGVVTPPNIQARLPIYENKNFDLIISRSAARGLGFSVAKLPKTFNVRFPWSGPDTPVTPTIL